MTETHTIELESREVRWLLDAVRWARESAESKGLRRNKNKLSRLETELEGQLPDYSEL